MKPGALPCLLALVTLAPAGAAVDTAKRNEAFAPKWTQQEPVETEQIEVGPSRPAAGSQQEFVTVPATDARVGVPQFRPGENATIEMTARTMPVRETAAAHITTAQPAPAKFEKKSAMSTVARIQDGMADAGRVKATTTKARAKGNLLERINRFVFRRNPVKPQPDAVPAGDANPPLEGAAAPSESSDS